MDMLEEILEEEVADIIDEKLSLIVVEFFDGPQNNLSAACQLSTEITPACHDPQSSVGSPACHDIQSCTIPTLVYSNNRPLSNSSTSL